MNFRLIVALLLSIFPISSGDAWAWGDQGHKVICEIAMRLVQPNTRAEIHKLIGTMNGSIPSAMPARGPTTHDKEQASTF
jgi:hypothetical protein